MEIFKQMLKSQFTTILVSVLMVLSSGAEVKGQDPAQVLEQVSDCLQDTENVSYQVATFIKDQGALADENVERPASYLQYLATNEQGGQWLGVVLIKKDNTCENPVPGDTYINYEEHAPFEIAVLLEKKQQQILVLQDEKVQEQIDAGNAPQGDLYVDDEVAADMNVGIENACEISASRAAARSQLNLPNSGCTVLEKETPQWLKP